MKTKLTALFNRHALAAALAAAFVVSAVPAHAQGGPGMYNQESSIDIPYEEYAKLTSIVSKGHIALTSSTSSPADVEQAIKTLIEMSQHESVSIHSQALPSLINVAGNDFPKDRKDAAAEALLILAQSAPLATRVFIANKIADLTKSDRILDYITAFSTDKSETVRQSFLQSLKRQIDRDEKQDDAALPQFIKGAADPSSLVREAAGEGLVVIAQRKHATHTAQAMAVLETLMNDPVERTRFLTRINIIKVGAEQASVTPRAIEVARIALADPTKVSEYWMQSWPLDHTVTLARKQPAFRAQVLSILEETANGNNPHYKLSAGIRLASMAVENLADHGIAMRIIPVLAASGDAGALNTAISAARDIAIANPALTDQALAILAQQSAKSTNVAESLAAVVEKRPAAASAIIGILDQSSAGTDEAIRGAGAKALIRIATAAKTEDARIFTLFTRIFNDAKGTLSAEPAQSGLSLLATRDAALLPQAIATLMARAADSDPFIRAQVAIGFGKIAATANPQSAQLLTALSTLGNDATFVTRVGVIKGLGLIVTGNPALSARAFDRIAAMAVDTTDSVRSEILRILRETATLPAAQTPAYVKALTLLRQDTRSNISGPADTIYSQRLFNDMTTLVPIRSRLEADLSATLANGAKAQAFLTDAAQLISAVDPVTRLKAAELIGQVGVAHGAQATLAVATLAPLVTDAEPDIRLSVVRYLGMIGMYHAAAAESAMQALAPMTTDSENRVASLAVMAVGKIGTQQKDLEDDAEAILKPLESTAPSQLKPAIRQQLKLLGP